MLMSANDLKFDQGRMDLSFDEADSWGSHPRSGLSVLMFALGDPERGPMVGLFNMPGKPGDEQKFPPIVHMHRSDSFRTIFNSDFYVGRKVYSDGLARLQRGGRYYGPEQLGPKCCANSETTYALLVFGDKRGHKVQPSDPVFAELVDRTDDGDDEKYRKLGAVAFPKEDKGRSDIRSNIGLKVAGHGDLSFKQAKAWPAVGETRLAAISLGDPECGPIVLAISAPPGATLLPAGSCGAELVTLPVHGACEIDGESYAPGRVRVQEAGVRQPAVVAGPDGANVYVVIADRRAELSVDAADAPGKRWAQQLAAQIEPLRARKDAAAA